VIFTGGEATLRPDLIELIEATEKIGLVSGLSTDGIRLSENKFLEKLLNSGLDHLLITLNEKEDQVWEALRDVIPQDIHTSVHITIDQKNNDYYLKIFDELKTIGVENISLSYIKPELEETVLTLRNQAAEYGFNLDWDLPVPYSHYNPVSAEVDIEGVTIPNGAGKGWLYLEPDGDVLPTQGYNKVLGNFLNDDFNVIWEKAKALQTQNE
jgi:MoaA/NifB/PqqE/SkfB family radical SAM enzyme